MSESKGLHDGHRDRVRKRFVKEGLESFYDHQVLEMMLFYGIPRKDTNDIAHRLLNKFGSFSAMLDAPLEALQECGISYNAAVLLKLFPAVCARYYQDKYYHEEKNGDRSNDENVEELIKPYFIGKNEEQVLLILLDGRGRQIFCDVVSRGTVSVSDVNIRKILQLSIQHRASSVIIAHDHSSGCNLPSVQDIQMTKTLRKSLKSVGIRLLDHYIIADMNCRSMAETEEYEDIFFDAK